jgi:hypothetical protein
MSVLIDCPADSGAAEAYTADESKMEVSLSKDNVCVVVLGNISYSGGIINRDNYRLWGSEFPDAVREYERVSPKLNVWCVLSRHEVPGATFFQERTVNNTNYLDMLELFAVPYMAYLQPNVCF